MVIKALFGFFFSSLFTQFPSLITHHSSFKIPHLVWHTFSISHHSIFSTFYGTHTWATFQAFLLAYLPHTISSHNFLPKPETSTQAFLFFFFFLQHPIPTTTTSVLSLKHKPTNFISILETPRKFINPPQPIRCPNLWFFFFIIIIFYESEMKK